MKDKDVQILLWETEIQEFIDKLRPKDEKIRAKLDFGFSFEKYDLILFETRPDFRDPDKHLQHPFAKAKYVLSKKIWKIYWKRASGKWELYSPNPQVAQLNQVLSTISEDKHYCFFG